MSKHTPGPWSINYKSTHFSRRPKSIIAGVGSIRSFNAHLWDSKREAAIANARLIAAAPEMLEALKCVEPLLEMLHKEEACEVTGIPLEKLRGAIAKALGSA